MEFRLLSPDDLPLVVGMEGDFRSGFVAEDAARKFLCDPRNLLFAAVADSRIVGFAYGYRLARLDGPMDKVYIHEVGVLPEWQRKGVGRRLLEMIKAYCRQFKCLSFFLITERSNRAACSLYQSAGGVDPHGDNMVYWFDAGARG